MYHITDLRRSCRNSYVEINGPFDYISTHLTVHIKRSNFPSSPLDSNNIIQFSRCYKACWYFLPTFQIRVLKTLLIINYIHLWKKLNSIPINHYHIRLFIYFSNKIIENNTYKYNHTLVKNLFNQPNLNIKKEENRTKTSLSFENFNWDNCAMPKPPNSLAWRYGHNHRQKIDKQFVDL